MRIVCGFDVHKHFFLLAPPKTTHFLDETY